MLTEDEARGIADRLDFKRGLSGMDLVVAIARDWITKEVLMHAYMNREAAVRTLATGRVTYWSTSRRELWVKGETSGCPQDLRGFSIDCDGDALLLDVEQTGPACHTGLDSCFDTYRSLDKEGLRTRLVEVIKQDALTFGDYTLTSGRKSNYYLDIKKVTTKPDRLSMVSELIASRFAGELDVFAGPELGAVPIVVGASLRAGVPFAIIRKGEREHGTVRKIEGDLGKNDRVLLIDDVTTTGGSLVTSVQTIRSAGAEVVRVTCVVDRKEGASEELESNCGLVLEPLLTIDDLGVAP